MQQEWHTVQGMKHGANESHIDSTGMQIVWHCFEVFFCEEDLPLDLLRYSSFELHVLMNWQCVTKTMLQIAVSCCPPILPDQIIWYRSSDRKCVTGP